MAPVSPSGQGGRGTSPLASRVAAPGPAIADATAADVLVTWFAGPRPQRGRVDAGPGEHLDGTRLRVRHDRREQVDAAGLRVTAPSGPSGGVFHRARGQRGEALAVPHHGYGTGVLDGALPAQAVADGALHEVAEETCDLGAVTEDGVDLGVVLQERVQQMGRVDLPVPVPDRPATGTRSC